MNLSDAAKVGDLETLKTAFTRGLHVDQRDKYYKTPLMTASSHGNIDIANYLIIARNLGQDGGRACVLFP